MFWSCPVCVLVRCPVPPVEPCRGQGMPMKYLCRNLVAKSALQEKERLVKPAPGSRRDFSKLPLHHILRAIGVGACLSAVFDWKYCNMPPVAIQGRIRHFVPWTSSAPAS